MKNTKEALKWIVGILNNNKIPFRISGGFAAKIYGSKRALADIDIEVPDKFVDPICEKTKKYVIRKALRYKDKEFDLYSAILKYKGQVIDICGATSSKIYDKNKKKWVKEVIDLKKTVNKKVYGIQVKVITLLDLIDYKSKIRRRV